MASDTGKIGHKRIRPIRWDKRINALKIRQVRTSVWRLGVQAGFTVLSILLGWQFYRFAVAVRTTASGVLPTRPPGVEGYLPISGLMGAIDWLYQGRLNVIHPAATILFLIFVAISLLLRKSFCGWICPAGFISENLARLGQLLFRKNWRLPLWLDYPLRSVKYLLLGFFVWAILSMGKTALHDFITSPYNKISDVKMMEFFTDMSATAGVILLIIAGLSVIVHSFWCRYLCPYGALMGLFSWLSPLKVRRNVETCTDCGICDNVCPARLPVDRKLSVGSVECIGCGDCVTSCPVPTALEFRTKRNRFNPRSLAVAVVSIFLVGYIAARLGGVWFNDLSPEEIRYHIRNMNNPEYTHPGR